MRQGSPVNLKRMILSGLIMLVALCATGASNKVLSANPATTSYVTDGIVFAIAQTSSTIYLGGSFNKVAPITGSGVPVSITTGKALNTFSKVNGTVQECVSDGAGGWFISGEFKQVGFLERNSIAHILPDGRVDPAWDANIDAGSNAGVMAVSDGVVYINGSFKAIDGQARNGLAALDVKNGAVKAWDPKPDGPASNLVISGNTAYIAGSFNRIGGQVRCHLAALDIISGAATAWNPNTNKNDLTVWSMAISEGKVYIGGWLGTIAGQERSSLAALDATSGVVMSWNPKTDGAVIALAISGGKVYVGGTFTHIGGQDRKYLAALDASNGAVTDWAPQADDYVRSLVVSGGTVYAGGSFSSINNQKLIGLAAIDAATGTLKDWNADIIELGGYHAYETAVYALAISGGLLYVGGKFTSIGGQMRKGLAALDATSGMLTDWDPDMDDTETVFSLEISGGKVYAGEDYTDVDRSIRHRLVALDSGSGAAMHWKINVHGWVWTLAAANGKLYAGGYFEEIGGQARKNLAAIDASSGALTAWKPNADSGVKALLVKGGTIYAGGNFSQIGGKTRYCLAALDAATGLVSNWNPGIGANHNVSALANSGDNRIYVGGNFEHIGGKAQNCLAAVDASSGAVLPWDPIIEQPDPSYPGLCEVTAIAITDGLVYIGGSFFSVGGQEHYNLAALDSTNAAVSDWNPDMEYASPSSSYEDAYVYALGLSGKSLYAGGKFTIVDNQNNPYLARFDPILPHSANPLAPGATNVLADRLTWTWTDASTDEDGFKVWADPGTGIPKTLRATTAAGATSWLYGGLSPNSPYTFQVAATNAIGDSARSTAFTTWTLIEPVSTLAFPAVTTTSIAVAPANTPSNLAAGVSGIYFSNDTAVTASGWQQNATPWISSSLTPNTRYIFIGRSRNGARVSGTGARDSRITQAAPPSPGNNVACDQTIATANLPGTVFTFSNPAGFGSGTHGGNPFKVTYYRWAWDTNPNYSFSGGEARWTAGSLVKMPTLPDNYYLHLQAVNGAGAATSQTLDFGPFNVIIPTGARNWQAYR